ncbi:MAG TPA: hypothetical protein VFR16_02500 [Agromyces mariniharenae]|nr:hypothetical protein [Agromyces mariniharenae]
MHEVGSSAVQLVERELVGGLEDVRRGLELAGLQAGLGCREGAVRPRSRVGRQLDRAPEERRRCRETASGARSPRRSLQLLRDGLVRPDRRRREMPRASVGLGRRIDGLGEREVNGSPVPRRRRAVDRRAHERMPEPHTAVDGEQALTFGRLCGRGIDAQPIRGAPEQDRIVGRLGGGEEEQEPRLSGKCLEASEEGLFDALGKLPFVTHDERPRELRRAQPPRQFQQRERIATGLRQQAITHPRVDPAGDDRLEECASVVVVETLQPQLGQAVEFAVRGRLPDGEDHRDRVREQPPGNEGERLPGGAVDPLRIVDEAEHGLLRSRLGEEAQCGE